MPIDATIPLSGIAPKITSPAQLMSLRDLAAQTKMRESELDYLPKRRLMEERKFEADIGASEATAAASRWKTQLDRQQKDDEFRKGVRELGLNTINIGRSAGYADDIVLNNMRSTMLEELDRANASGRLAMMGIDEAGYQERRAAIMNSTIEQIEAAAMTPEQAMERAQYPAAGGAQQPQAGMPLSQLGQPAADPTMQGGSFAGPPGVDSDTLGTADAYNLLQNDVDPYAQPRGPSAGNAGMETQQTPGMAPPVSLADVSRGTLPEAQTPWDALDAQADAIEARGGKVNFEKAEKLRARAEQLRDNDRDERRLSAQTKAKFGASEISMTTGELSPGWKKLDEKAAEEFSEFIIAGGSADVEKNIGQLEDSLKELEQSDELTGIFLGNLPDKAQEAFFPRAVAVREQIEEVVQRNLRLVLGAQFTEKEGERLIARAFNPRLPEAENAKRVKRLITSIKRAAEAKQSAYDYFVENGTLRGYKGKTSFSTFDFERELPEPVFATNPKTGDRQYTTDGGKTWQKAQ